MMPTSEADSSLLRQTRLHFPEFAGVELQLALIEKGGSGRKFYRVREAAGRSIVLMKYDAERAENRLYTGIAEFLVRHQIRAPRIFFHDTGEGLVWLEDLGERDLWSERAAAWPARRALYESALDQIAELHRLPESAVDSIRENLSPPFDASLYRWEQNHFFENCLGRYFQLGEKELKELAALPALAAMAERLGKLPRVLVHRDFQSQNILLRDGEAWLIDFQGMRPGLAEYDLASLLYDPYVSLAETERAGLVEYYRAAFGPGRSDFDEIFQLCAMQRLMQALGAYGFLGLARGEKTFLGHIAPAVRSLRSIMKKRSGLEKLERALAKLSF